MAITDDLRKTLSDPTPLYFAAGTADLALQQARKVPALVEQLRTEAPARIEAVRNTDRKVVQDRATAFSKEAGARVKETQTTIQTKVGQFLNGLDSDIKKFGSNLDADLKKLGETAQDFALRGVGVAAEYAVKARETYEKVAEHGEQAVKTWRGEAADEIEELAVAVEGKPEPVVVKDEPKPAEAEAKAEPTAIKKPVAKKAPAPAKKPVAKKTTPPAK
jgi:heparin binding hemagglutinin HbhA